MKAITVNHYQSGLSAIDMSTSSTPIRIDEGVKLMKHITTDLFDPTQHAEPVCVIGRGGANVAFFSLGPSAYIDLNLFFDKHFSRPLS